MSILAEVLAELFGMFLADIRLTAAILALVAGVAAAMHWGAIGSLTGGGALLAGCLVLVIASVVLAARAASR
ncbi:MAG: hypothetical protein P1U88_16880 [Thalassobaculaceae bacterium]|nr:hypothetical protein [Thalassobaculaceae bacterium]